MTNSLTDADTSGSDRPPFFANAFQSAATTICASDGIAVRMSLSSPQADKNASTRTIQTEINNLLFFIVISFDDINSLDELQQVPLSPYAGATYPGSQDGNHKTAPTPLPPD